jgi:CheY-like chemotaxis protein
MVRVEGTTLPLHVLVVEDDEDTLVPEAELLSALGCRVDVAGDGAVAVKQALELEPQVILMDLTVPIIDGYEATRQIRQRAPPSYHPHIIALSGYSDDRSRQLAFEAGCDEFIQKPATDLRTPLRAYVSLHPECTMNM